MLKNKLLMDDSILDGLSNQERFELDFQSIELFYEEIDLYDKIIDPDEWKFAFFENPDDNEFHFYREAKNGIWFHKLGWLNSPTCICQNKIIKDPIIAAQEEYEGYEYQRCYRLRK